MAAKGPPPPGGRPLSGRVYVVTGATRGIGRGVAIGLGEAGATVILTGRTGSAATPGGACLDEVAAAVTAAGGVAHPAVVDHGEDASVDAFWADTVPRLAPAGVDGLVNNAYAGVSTLAENLHRPCIGGVVPLFDPLYSVGKVALDRLTADGAAALQAEGVAMMSVWPGMVSTEKMVAYMGAFDAAGDTTPLYVGRCLAVLLGWPAERLLAASGAILLTADLGRAAGVVDEAGRSPPSFRSTRYLAAVAVPALAARWWVPDLLLPWALVRLFFPRQRLW
ncbi:hypothetical protein I4F81_002562 [Pyropia yezoensis]|uniref:Uncharacterized protein n=1 Tax=Pyropia yezoensis TaxID=2788 RepID=A0ACC3BQE4_PYRYE|nr:hypothetical protein I4F81_002562 [Neopyropia yezoensis]